MNFNKINVLMFALVLCSIQISKGMSNLYKMRTDDLQKMINEGLLQAVRDDNYNVVKNMINQGADVSYKDDSQVTPLIWAAYLNELDIVKLLVENGADINSAIFGNKTALMNAAEKGNIHIVRFLLDHGANIDTVGYTGTALELAEKNGHHAVANLIKEYKAKRAKEIEEATPLIPDLINIVKEYEGNKKPKIEVKCETE